MSRGAYAVGWGVLAVVVTGCAGSPRAGRDAQADAGAGVRRAAHLDGVAFSVLEQAHDGAFVMAPATGKPQEVDANSRLVVSFQVQAAADLAAAGPEWQALDAGLQAVQAILTQGAVLDAFEVAAGDAAAEAQLLQALQEHYQRVATFARSFRAAIESHRRDLDVNAILEGRFDGKSQGPLVNAARWLEVELVRLREDAVARVRNRERVRVLVQAYHEPRTGDRQQLHVDNYDRLPVGELRPIDRLGLKLSPQERARLDAEIATSKRAAAAIEEVRRNGKSFLASIENRVAQWKLSLRTLANTVRQAQGWREQLAATLASLQQLATGATDPRTKAAANELAAAWPELLTALEATAGQGATRALLERMAEQLVAGEPQRALALLGDLREVFESDFADVVDVLQEKVQAVRAAVQALAATVPAAELARVLPGAVQEVLAALPSELPATWAFVANSYEIVRAGAARSEVAGVLTATPDIAIPRPLDDLPDGTIDLTRAGVNLDDHVSIQVRFAEERADGQEVTLEQVGIDSRMVLTGLHRRIGGELIFARSDHGPAAAQQWQANVAAVASWHYRYRDAHETKWRTAWNFLDPGIGLHIASLNQNDDTAEAGLGLNLSLFGGFVTGGAGYNLSTEDGDGLYYFVGIDLLDVLQQAGSAVSAGR